jgi:hypothetical protein
VHRSPGVFIQWIAKFPAKEIICRQTARTKREAQYGQSAFLNDRLLLGFNNQPIKYSPEGILKFYFQDQGQGSTLSVLLLTNNLITPGFT